jgi:hypothetical protein
LGLGYQPALLILWAAKNKDNAKSHVNNVSLKQTFAPLLGITVTPKVYMNGKAIENVPVT